MYKCIWAHDKSSKKRVFFLNSIYLDKNSIHYFLLACIILYRFYYCSYFYSCYSNYYSYYYNYYYFYYYYTYSIICSKMASTIATYGFSGGLLIIAMLLIKICICYYLIINESESTTMRNVLIMVVDYSRILLLFGDLAAI